MVNKNNFSDSLNLRKDTNMVFTDIFNYQSFPSSLYEPNLWLEFKCPTFKVWFQCDTGKVTLKMWQCVNNFNQSEILLINAIQHFTFGQIWNYTNVTLPHTSPVAHDAIFSDWVVIRNAGVDPGGCWRCDTSWIFGVGISQQSWPILHSAKCGTNSVILPHTSPVPAIWHDFCRLGGDPKRRGGSWTGVGGWHPVILWSWHF